MNELYVGIAAVAGGVASGLLGWHRSNEPFSVRKLGATVVHSLVGGAGAAGMYLIALDVPTIKDLFLAFGAGAGVDVLWHRGAGTIK